MRKELFLAALLAAAAARPAWGQAVNCTPGLPASPDGTICMAEDAISAGGACMKDSLHNDNCATKLGMKLTFLMGKFSQPLSGGGLQLWPGVLAAVKVAAADTSYSHPFPTPFMPSQGNDRITFSSLPPEVIIKIYTLSGHLVKTLTKSDPSDRLVWMPVANEQGSTLASGVYLFIIKQVGATEKKGKLMIIR
jgi:hypothetical protein